MAWGVPASLGGAATGVTSGSGSTGTFTAPAAGRFLFVVGTIKNGGITGFTPPSGWTTLRSAQDASGVYSVLLAKIAAGTEGAALASTWTGSGEWEFGNVYSVSGAPASLAAIEEAAVWHNIVGVNAANPYPAVAGSAATTGSNELLLWVFARVSSATFSTWQAAGGFTELEDEISGGTATTATSHTLAYKVLGANETPSAQLNLSNGTREYNGWVIALIPGGGSIKGITTTTISATSTMGGLVGRRRPITTTLVSATSTMSGNIGRIRPVTPTLISATSTVNAIVGRRRPIITTLISATSVATGNVSRLKALVPAVISATSTVAGAFIDIRPIVPSAISATSVMTGAIARRRPIVTFVISATSVMSGSVAQHHRAVSGAIAATSALSGTIRRLRNVIGNISAVSTVGSSFGAVRHLAGAVAATSTVSGTLHMLRGVRSAVVLATSTVTGSIRIGGGKFSGLAISATSTVTGAIVRLRPLVGAITASSTLSGALGRLEPISGAITATSTLTGTVVRLRAITANIDASATVTGTVVLQIHIYATSTVSGTVAFTTAQGVNGAVLLSAQSSPGDLLAAEEQTAQLIGAT